MKTKEDVVDVLKIQTSYTILELATIVRNCKSFEEFRLALMEYAILNTPDTLKKGKK